MSYTISFTDGNAILRHHTGTGIERVFTWYSPTDTQKYQFLAVREALNYLHATTHDARNLMELIKNSRFRID